MKNLVHVSIFALTLTSLNSCVSISNVADDDVYMVKSTLIPSDESLDDETSYSAYKYKKDQNNNLTRYQGAGPSAFRGGMGVGMGNGYMGGYNPYMYNPYGYNPYGYSPYGYNPYGAYDPYGYYSPYGHQGSSLVYMPGYGWTYMGGNAYGYGHGYYGNNGFYGNNGYYGNNYGYGGGFYGGGLYGGGYYGNPYYGNPYYGNGGFYGNNGYGNNGGYSSPSYGVAHASGPRGSSSGGGVMTRRDIPGTVKMGTAPVSSSTPMGVKASSGDRIRPVGNNESMTSSRQSQSATRIPSNYGGSGAASGSDNNATGTSTTLNRPGRVESFPGNASSGNNSGRTYNSGSGATPTRGSARTYENSSPSTTPSRSSGTREYSTPSRSSGTREYSAPSRSSGSGSSGGGSGSSGGGSRPSGGSTGGGRR